MYQLQQKRAHPVIQITIMLHKSMAVGAQKNKTGQQRDSITHSVSIRVTLANHSLLWVHICRRGQISLSFKCVQLYCMQTKDLWQILQDTNLPAIFFTKQYTWENSYRSGHPKHCFALVKQLVGRQIQTGLNYTANYYPNFPCKSNPTQTQI